MGEWNTVDLRKMAGALPFADMDRGIPETSNALRWAADRIEYLEGFIEATEHEAAAQLPAADTVSLLQNLGHLVADATNEGDYDPENDLVRDPFCRRVIDGINAAIAEVDRLSAMVYETGPGEFSPDGWTDLEATIAAALAAERAKFAAFADEKGEPRKVLGTLPVLASGEFVTEGEVVHHPNQDLSIPGDLWIQKVDDSVLSHSRFPESLRECEYVAAHYYAEYDVGFFFAEFFDVSECYSTPEAATSALDAAKEQP